MELITQLGDLAKKLNDFRLRNFTKNEVIKLLYFKSDIERFKSKYEFWDDKDLKLMQTKLEIDINLKNRDNTIQIVAPFFSLMVILSINIFSIYNNSFQNTVQAKIKSLVDVSKIFSIINNIFNLTGDIIDFFTKGILGIICFIVLSLIISEGRRLMKIKTLSIQLFVIDKLIAERTSLNSNWQLWK